MFSNDFRPRIFVVSRPKLPGLPHVGLLLADDTVMHCTPERGAHRSTPEEFALGFDVRVVREIPAEFYGMVMQRVYWIERNPQPYRLLGLNCYDFVNWLTAQPQPAPVGRPLWSS
jgi:hypothetical protein